MKYDKRRRRCGGGGSRSHTPTQNLSPLLCADEWTGKLNPRIISILWFVIVNVMGFDDVNRLSKKLSVVVMLELDVFSLSPACCRRHGSGLRRDRDYEKLREAVNHIAICQFPAIKRFRGIREVIPWRIKVCGYRVSLTWWRISNLLKIRRQGMLKLTIVSSN